MNFKSVKTVHIIILNSITHNIFSIVQIVCAKVRLVYMGSSTSSVHYFCRMIRFLKTIAVLLLTMWCTSTSQLEAIAKSSFKNSDESTTSHQRTTLTLSALIPLYFKRKTSLFRSNVIASVVDSPNSWRQLSKSRYSMNNFKYRK